METVPNQFNIKELLKNPTALMEGFKNPTKFGLDIYKSLSTRNKQYLAFAGGAGLIIYGITLNKKK